MTPEERKKPPLSATISWILYDFANTAYSMNVVSLYFVTWVIIELGQRDAVVAIANSISMILVAFTLPVLGDYSDCKGKKMISLAFFTALCIAGTVFLGKMGGLGFGAFYVPVIVLIYILANYGYQGGLVFYNALMPSISTAKTIGRISGYGVALGYLGAIVGLIVARIFVDGEFFGISIPGVAAGGPTAAFVPTAIIFFVFAIPVFVFVREPKIGGVESDWRIKKSYVKVLNTIKDTQKYPGLLRFLIAKLLYEDSIHTIIIFMGVYTQEVVGFTLAEANQFFIIVIPSAVIGSAFCGVLVDHYGPHKTLLGVILLWILGLVMVTLTSNRLIFWGLGCLIGALLGSTWTSARPLLVTLVPRHMLGEFFGLYSLSGKVAAVIGPLVWSTVTLAFSRFGAVVKYKAAISCLAIIMVAGFAILRRVPDYHAKQKAATDQ